MISSGAGVLETRIGNFLNLGGLPEFALAEGAATTEADFDEYVLAAPQDETFVIASSQTPQNISYLGRIERAIVAHSGLIASLANYLPFLPAFTDPISAAIQTFTVATAAILPLSTSDPSGEATEIDPKIVQANEELCADLTLGDHHVFVDDAGRISLEQKPGTLEFVLRISGDEDSSFYHYEIFPSSTNLQLAIRNLNAPAAQASRRMEEMIRELSDAVRISEIPVLSDFEIGINADMAADRYYPITRSLAGTLFKALWFNAKGEVCDTSEECDPSDRKFRVILAYDDKVDRFSLDGISGGKMPLDWVATPILDDKWKIEGRADHHFGAPILIIDLTSSSVPINAIARTLNEINGRRAKK